jgi:hypothetical protein
MKLEDLVKIGKSVFIGSLMIGVLCGCSKDNNPTSPGDSDGGGNEGGIVNNSPYITSIVIGDRTFNGINSYTDVYMTQYASPKEILLKVNARDPDGDQLYYYWEIFNRKEFSGGFMYCDEPIENSSSRFEVRTNEPRNIWMSQWQDCYNEDMDENIRVVVSDRPNKRGKFAVGNYTIHIHDAH